MRRIKVLGISFAQGSIDEILATIAKGGLTLFPSGPGLAVDLPQKPNYREALYSAENVFPDSGLMVLVWNWICPQEDRLHRYSGLRFLRDLFSDVTIKAPGRAFWVMPSAEEMERSIRWLQANGFDSTTESDCYIAPYYRRSLAADGSIQDPSLLKLIEARRPSHVFLGLGSGVQEQLGLYLRTHLSYRPALLGTGAAMSFLTGGQASIPVWADRIFAGWLLRILSDPKQFIGRYVAALRLIPLLLRHREKALA